jgi:hypothetical protein
MRGSKTKVCPDVDNYLKESGWIKDGTKAPWLWRLKGMPGVWYTQKHALELVKSSGRNHRILRSP